MFKCDCIVFERMEKFIEIYKAKTINYNIAYEKKIVNTYWYELTL